MPLMAWLLLFFSIKEFVMKFEAVARRVLAESDEMPGLVLTTRQAARIFGLDHDLCRTILDSLVDMAYLREVNGLVRRGDRIAA